jgi:hypothetical protein
MRRISRQAHDKLQALLSAHQDTRLRAAVPIYEDACATWLSGLTEAERRIADKALNAYENGSKTGAQELAAKLPAAPKCPL